MLELTNKEMYQINGGAIKWGVVAGIGALISFIAGIFDGQIKLK